MYTVTEGYSLTACKIYIALCISIWEELNNAVSLSPDSGVYDKYFDHITVAYKHGCHRLQISATNLFPYS